MNPSIEVIKLGGSLFEWIEFPDTFRKWFRKTSLEDESRLRVIVPGGGRLADQIRSLDKRFQLPPRSTHWAAIEAMDLHANLCCDWLDGYVWEAADLIARCQDIGNDDRSTDKRSAEGNREKTDPPGCCTSQPIFLRVLDWLRNDEQVVPLPDSWKTTSDSIAAALAIRLSASQLTLLKSCPVEAEHSYHEWAMSGRVDPTFPQLAKQIPSVHWVCLKHEKSPVANS